MKVGAKRAVDGARARGMDPEFSWAYTVAGYRGHNALRFTLPEGRLDSRFRGSDHLVVAMPSIKRIGITFSSPSTRSKRLSRPRGNDGSGVRARYCPGGLGITTPEKQRRRTLHRARYQTFLEPSVPQVADPEPRLPEERRFFVAAGGDERALADAATVNEDLDLAETLALAGRWGRRLGGHPAL